MKAPSHALIGAAILAALLTLSSLDAFSQTTQKSAPAGTAPVGPTKENLLTYTAKNQPLQSILNEIGDQAGVVMVVADDVGAERISVEFKDFRLDEAFRQILEDYDVFFYYGNEKNDKTASLKAVWVYPAGLGQSLQPAPPEDWASTQEFERMLGDRDPEVRAGAVDTLIERKGPQAGELVMKALRDDSELVRAQALDRALSSDLDIPQATLNDLALHDTSVNVRFLALEALSEDPNSRWVAEQALRDPDQSVRDLARGLLRQFDALDTARSRSR